MQNHLKEVNAMFAKERRKGNERYKKYDGVCLGRYAQWFVGVFFCLGFFGFCGYIGESLWEVKPPDLRLWA